MIERTAKIALKVFKTSLNNEINAKTNSFVAHVDLA